MKLTRNLFAAIAAFALALAPSVHAQGIPVYDFQSTLQTIKVLQANQAQISKLGNILGVNTEQLGQLKGISTTLGNASRVANYGEKFSPAQLGKMIKGVPGLENVDLNTVFKSSGALDLFSKVPIGQWDKVVSDPYNYYSQMLMSEAIKNVGQDVGLDTREIKFVNYLKRQNPKYLNKERAARQLSDIMLDRWQQEAKERREKLQVMSETSNALAQKASEAPTLVEQAAGNTAVLNQQVKTSILAAEQATKAAEVQSSVTDQGNKLLENQIALEQMRMSAKGIRTK